MGKGFNIPLGSSSDLTPIIFASHLLVSKALSQNHLILKPLRVVYRRGGIYVFHNSVLGREKVTKDSYKFAIKSP